MAIPGTPSCTYVADGLEHDPRGKPSTSAADHQAQLDKRLRKLAEFDFGDCWADVRGVGETAILTWGSSAAVAREAAERLRARGHSVRVIALRLLLPASPEKLAAALEGVTRVLVLEQSHGRQFHHYLRAYYDIVAETRSLARPGQELKEYDPRGIDIDSVIQVLLPQSLLWSHVVWGAQQDLHLFVDNIGITLLTN